MKLWAVYKTKEGRYIGHGLSEETTVVYGVYATKEAAEKALEENRATMGGLEKWVAPIEVQE